MKYYLWFEKRRYSNVKYNGRQFATRLTTFDGEQLKKSSIDIERFLCVEVIDCNLDVEP